MRTKMQDRLITAFAHEATARLAHELWIARGCPEGSPQQDWFHAVEQLRSSQWPLQFVIREPALQLQSAGFRH